MKKIGLLSAGLVAAAAMTSAASADVKLDLGSHSWAAGGFSTYNFNLMGSMTGFTVSVDWVNPDGSDTWGSDLGIQIQTPDGGNGFWGGYDIVGFRPGAFDGGLLDLGTTISGHYSDTVGGLSGYSGTGTWKIDIGNAYAFASGSGQWNNISLTLHGVDVPAPGAVALLGMAGLVSRRRRA